MAKNSPHPDPLLKEREFVTYAPLLLKEKEFVEMTGISILGIQLLFSDLIII
jgi:hypothetical protein